MKMEVINPKNEVTTTYTNKRYIIAKFTSLLFNKFIVKSQSIKRIVYNYNYSDKQTIKFIFDNDYKQVFYDIPTSSCLLNEYELENLMKEGEKNEKTS